MLPDNNTEMSVIEHLEELRKVLIISLAATAIFAIGAYFFCDQILAVILEPIKNLGQRVIFTGVTEAFFVKIKLSIYVGFLAALPIILWQVWSFIVPALKRNERIYFILFVVVSFICFIGGTVFGYFSVFRLGIIFLLRFAGPELIPMLTIDKYISFTISFLLPFGVIFELPLISFFLAKLQLISYRFLAKNRRYAAIAIVTIAAAITPTVDLVTCLFVSGPFYLLYEMSIWIVLMVERGIARKKLQQELHEMGNGQSTLS